MYATAGPSSSTLGNSHPSPDPFGGVNPIGERGAYDGQPQQGGSGSDFILVEVPRISVAERTTAGPGRFSNYMGSQSHGSPSDSVFTPNWYRVPTPSSSTVQQVPVLGHGCQNGGFDTRGVGFRPSAYSVDCVLQSVPAQVGARDSLRETDSQIRNAEPRAFVVNRQEIQRAEAPQRPLHNVILTL